MGRSKTVEPLEDDALEAAAGGGTGRGHELTHTVQQDQTRYVGETEKNLLRTPPGRKLTHDPAFETWAGKD